MSIDQREIVNSLDYWDARYASGDWASKGGYTQTRLFAEAQLPFIRIHSDFNGSICDFGCGAGDAFSVYRHAWPLAKLFGVDFSESAIQLCAERYGQIANFVCGDVSSVPAVDYIICSNVIEHLADDMDTVTQLLEKCSTLFVIVPYKERPLSNEHVRSYDENYFSAFTVVRKVVFKSMGWTEFGIRNNARIYLENMSRLLKNQPMRRRRKQILFEISASPR